MMKPPRMNKLPLSIIVVAVSAFAFIAVLHLETVSSFSSSPMFKFKSCPKKDKLAESSKSTSEADSSADKNSENYDTDDRFEFDPTECSIASGKWVFNSSFRPLYSDRTCPYLDRQVSCVKNGREDSDYRRWEWQLEDCLIRNGHFVSSKGRCMEVAPIMAPYWEKAEFPFQLVPKLASLRVASGTIKGYGCPGMSLTGSAIATAEVARVDASCSTFILVHSSLAMLTIALCGSEEQKHKNLPSLAELKTVACWALTEPDYGSDASALKTIATKVEGGWVLEGQKRWIGNSTFADVVVVFARNTTTNQINGYIVKKHAPGLSVTKIENKIGLRMVQNCDILLKRVFVPDEDRLPGVNSFQDTNKVLAVSRVMVAWQPIGISMGVYDMCHRYLKERKQFGVPSAGFQINQEKLVRMLGNVQAMVLVGWRLCKMYEKGTMTPGRASLAKSWISLRARETVALGRELLGGNGILSDFLVAKAFCDLEPIYTYEGTYDINSLVTGREITGLASFKPAARSRN